MKEINKKTLIEELSSMKEYSPPDTVWENIDMELELGADEFVSKKMLAELPEHEPPEMVWEKISKRIRSKGSARLVPMRWRRPLSIAASIAALLAAYFTIQPLTPIPSGEEKISLVYSTETIDNRLLENDWDQDDEAFELYKELCDAKKYICEHPEFQTLQNEFEELTAAVEELEYAIGNYGSDASLVLQIKEIELERTGLFKKMMVMLI
ncbi:MAG: hypothetical protein AAFZ15_17470 [Bacteroidota bacterium]